MSETLVFVLSIVGVFVAFPLLWSAIVWLISRFGWAGLAAAYPADEWPEGEGVRLHMQSLTVGHLGNYSSSVTVVATVDGLYLRPILVFRMGHDPVFVPWSAMEVEAERLFGRLKVALGSGHSLSLFGKTARYTREVLTARRREGI